MYIYLGHVQRCIDWPIAVLWLPTHHPTPFRAYFAHRVGQQLDLERLVIGAGCVLQEFHIFELVLFQLLNEQRKKKIKIEFKIYRIDIYLNTFQTDTSNMMIARMATK